VNPNRNSQTRGGLAVKVREYYEFRAIDRPLDKDQIRDLQMLSGRARVTPTSFVGDLTRDHDFGGDPDVLMERYFDAFLYFDQSGSRQLMFRLPTRLLDLDTVHPYRFGAEFAARVKGKNLFLTFSRQEYDSELTYMGEDPKGRLESILPIRADLASGDLRALYLGWLMSVQECEDWEAPEPPVPPNLDKLTEPLKNLVRYMLLGWKEAHSEPEALLQQWRDMLRVRWNNRTLDGNERVDMAARVAKRNRAQGIELLVEIARDTTLNFYARERAAEKVLGMGDGRGIDLLLEIVSTPGVRSDVRMEIAARVRELDTDRGIEVYASLARDTTLNAWTRSTAQDAWTRTAEQIALADYDRGVDLLTEMARDTTLEFRARMEAADALAEIGRDRCILLLTEIARDTTLHAGDRADAARYIAELGREVRGMQHVLVEQAEPPGQDERPSRIVDHDGLTWLVDNVVEYWERPGGADTANRRSETRRWRLEVTGPLPGAPDQHSHQQVVLVTHGDGTTGWWMGPADTAPPTGEARRQYCRGLTWLFHQPAR
jgi:hypothetical protein